METLLNKIVILLEDEKKHHKVSVILSTVSLSLTLVGVIFLVLRMLL